MKQSVILVVALAALLVGSVALVREPGEGGSTPSAASTFDRIVTEGKMTVCYVPWPPLIIKEPNTGALSGFIIDIWNEVAADAHLETAYVESTWGGFTADLKTGKCDAGVAGFYPTIGRSASVAFTEPFLYAGNGAAGRAGDGRFTTLGDLNRKGIRVAVVQGEYGHIYAEKYLPDATLVILEKSADLTMPLVSVSSGQADVGLSTTNVIEAYVEQHPEVQELFGGAPYSTTPVAWAVRTGDQELLNFLNNALGYLAATGAIEQSVQRYHPAGIFQLAQEYEALS